MIVRRAIAVARPGLHISNVGDKRGGGKGRTRADAGGVCGWIVDVRNNGGGNVWPMLDIVALMDLLGKKW